VDFGRLNCRLRLWRKSYHWTVFHVTRYEHIGSTWSAWCASVNNTVKPTVTSYRLDDPTSTNCWFSSLCTHCGDLQPWILPSFLGPAPWNNLEFARICLLEGWPAGSPEAAPRQNIYARNRRFGKLGKHQFGGKEIYIVCETYILGELGMKRYTALEDFVPRPLEELVGRKLGNKERSCHEETPLRSLSRSGKCRPENCEALPPLGCSIVF
jgi:hypothetical protein